MSFWRSEHWLHRLYIINNWMLVSWFNPYTFERSLIYVAHSSARRREKYKSSLKLRCKAAADLRRRASLLYFIHRRRDFFFGFLCRKSPRTPSQACMYTVRPFTARHSLNASILLLAMRLPPHKFPLGRAAKTMGVALSWERGERAGFTESHGGERGRERDCREMENGVTYECIRGGDSRSGGGSGRLPWNWKSSRERAQSARQRNNSSSLVIMNIICKISRLIVFSRLYTARRAQSSVTFE